MACNEYFSKIFTKIEKLYNKLGKEIEKTKMLMQGCDTEYAYSYSLRIHEESEKITMLARNLPCSLGMRDAEERVRSEMEKIVPVEIGYTEEGWFSIQMFSLLPRKEHGNVNYIRQCLYYEMMKFSKKKHVRFRKTVYSFTGTFITTVFHNGRCATTIISKSIWLLISWQRLFCEMTDHLCVCRHYYCSAKGSENRSEVYVVPQTDFEKWLKADKKMPDEGIKLFPESPKNI